MRASSLSDPKIITLLNRYFVPVYVSREDVAEWGNGPPEEKAEHQRIYLEAVKAGLSTGTVHVYILTPDGHPIDSLHVAEACKPDQLIPLLERTVQKLKPRPGAPVSKPTAQSKTPQHEADSLVLHLTARVLKAGSGWDHFPAESWIVLKSSQWAKFLPPRNIAVGKSWDIDKAAAAEVLMYFFPATDNSGASAEHIEQQELRGKIISNKDGVTRVRLSGRLKMRHNFYYKDDGKVVEAALIGFLDVDTRNNRIQSFRLVTDEADYGRGTFGVAVRSEP
jgi:hypothetical protein